MFGKPQNVVKEQTVASATHEKLVERISTYCLNLAKEDPVRLHYLCFMASIVSCESAVRLGNQDPYFYFEVALELLQQAP